MSVFEWDLAKNAANVFKHQVDFSDAVRIFEGPVLERSDDRRNYGEDRYTAIGEVAGQELFVVYTIRAGNRRIISARKASRHEREAYRKARREAR